MAWSRAVQGILRAALARQPRTDEAWSLAAGLDDREFANLVVAARYHGVAGYVARALDGAVELSGRPALEFLRREPLRTLAMHLRTLGDLEHVGTTLDRAGIDWLVLKGPVLAEAVHASPTLRGYTDLDVLVAPARFGAALEALEGSGCRTLDRNWTLFEREFKGEVRMIAPSGTLVDLHWHPLNVPRLRERFPLRTNDLLERRRDVAVGQRRVPTLDAASQVPYVALHAVVTGLHRLVWLKDIELVAAEAATTPHEVVATARSWRAELPLAVGLAQVRRTLGPAAASPIEPRLRTSWLWLTLCAAAAARAPVEADDGSGTVLRLATRSTRDNLPVSLLDGLGRAAGFIRSAVRRQSVIRGADGRLHPDHPGSGVHEGGGASARRSYLEAVARAE